MEAAVLLSLEPPTISSCPQCGTQLAPTMLACPGCGRLVHGDTLARMAQEAREAKERGDIQEALSSWRAMLALLPTGSKQHQVVVAKITELGDGLSRSTDSSPSSTGQKSRGWGIATGIGAIGFALWKFKALLVGLTKGTTLLSMLASLGVYWAAWGWKFALGLVLSIYVHEMGHVFALHRYGFKASAPMFIPGLGALIRLQQKVVSAKEDAAIGLAGPIYGFGAAIVCLVLWIATQAPIFAALAGVGAWINLFNSTPISSLDGSRGFRAMSRAQKFLATATVAGAWFVSKDGLLIIVALVCLGRAVTDKPNQEDSWRATITYCLLVILLTAVAAVRTLAPIGQ